MQTKTSEQNATGVRYERVPQPKKRSRSQRVELVIARIFAKQRAYTKLRIVSTAEESMKNHY
jgi:hypothetical protein